MRSKRMTKRLAVFVFSGMRVVAAEYGAARRCSSMADSDAEVNTRLQ